MIKLFFTGDLHGEAARLSYKRCPKLRELSEGDLLFITGDFGVIWADEPDNKEKYCIKFLEDKPWTTVFIDGNHENHNRLDALKTKDFFGGTVGAVSDKVLHAKRGEIYTVNGLKILTFGGAMSTDRGFGDPGWWEREIPNSKEMEHCVSNLERVNYKVDIILTHTMPSSAVAEYEQVTGHVTHRIIDPTARFLENIYKYARYRLWMCGHFHCNRLLNETQVQILYKDVVEFKDNRSV